MAIFSSENGRRRAEPHSGYWERKQVRACVRLQRSSRFGCDENAITDHCDSRPVAGGVQPSGTGGGGNSKAGTEDGLGEATGDLVPRFGDERRQRPAQGKGIGTSDGFQRKTFPFPRFAE